MSSSPSTSLDKLNWALYVSSSEMYGWSLLWKLADVFSDPRLISLFLTLYWYHRVVTSYLWFKFWISRNNYFSSGKTKYTYLTLETNPKIKGLHIIIKKRLKNLVGNKIVILSCSLKFIFPSHGLIAPYFFVILHLHWLMYLYYWYECTHYKSCIFGL